MDGGIMNDLKEVSLRNAREHRDDMARWLALEVLMTDEMALEDTTLQEHLILLQDKIEAKVRGGMSRAQEIIGVPSPGPGLTSLD
jgi:hypothetical protein